jgi:hypothetical protein
MFFIAWRYEVNQSISDVFEKEYGKNGTWADFFSASDEYLGSMLT